MTPKLSNEELNNRYHAVGQEEKTDFQELGTEVVKDTEEKTV